MDMTTTPEARPIRHLSPPSDDALAARIAATLKPVPDFPRVGVQFQDMASFYAAPEIMRDTATAIVEAFRGEFDAVLAIEARGFPIGTLVAQQAGSSLVLARKQGKLPGETHAVSYDLEYGSAVLEIQHGTLGPESRALVIDDVLATGGTFEAAARLVEACGAHLCGFAAILEIAGLGGQERLAPSPVFIAHSIK